MKTKGLSLLIVLLVLLASGPLFAAGQVKEEAVVKEITWLDGAWMTSWLDNFEKANGWGLVEKFEEDTGIKVNLELYPFRELFQAIEVQMNAKSDNTDVIAVDSPLTASYAVRGYTTPLEGDRIPDESKYYSATLKLAQWQDEYHNRPFMHSSQLMYVNVDLFEKAGVPLPSPDIDKRLTWEEVVEISRTIQNKLNQGDTQVWGLAFQQVNRPYQMLPLVQSIGAGSGIGPDGLTVQGYLNNAGWQKVMQWWYNVYNVWNISPKGLVAGTIDPVFQGGTVAMYVAGTWALPGCVAAQEEGRLNFYCVPHPYFEGGEPVNAGTGWNYAVNPYSKKKEAAWKLIEYLTSDEVAKAYHRGTGNMVANKGFQEAVRTDSKYNTPPYSAIRDISLYELENTSLPRPTTPMWLEWEDLVTKAFADVSNGADPKETLDRTAAQLETIAKKYK